MNVYVCECVCHLHVNVYSCMCALSACVIELLCTCVSARVRVPACVTVVHCSAYFLMSYISSQLIFVVSGSGKPSFNQVLYTQILDLVVKYEKDLLLFMLMLLLLLQSFFLVIVFQLSSLASRRGKRTWSKSISYGCQNIDKTNPSSFCLHA